HSPLPLPPILPARRSHPLLRRASSSAPPCCFFIVRSGSLKPAEALLPLKEGPDGTDGGNHDSTCGDGRWGQWMKGPLVRAFSISSSSSLSSCKNKKSDLRLLLGVLGAPLAPVHVCTTDPFPYLSIKDIPVVSPLFLLRIFTSPSSGISKGALAGIVLGAIAFAVTLSVIVDILILRICLKDYRTPSKRTKESRISIIIEDIRSFDYEEMVATTNNFSDYAQIEQARYGRFFKGFLPDGTVAAIKRAQEGSLQGEREFLTEIQLLSRLHHRNLVSLVGYCDEKGEQ
ncbi:putative LRR receptor-like serine/threonine-protein kinase, partial [Glycine soja]